MKITNSALKSQVEFLFSEYVDLVSDVIRKISVHGNSSTHVSDQLVDLVSECLCHRDELDNYLADSSGKSAKSILNCSGLDNYEQLFDFVRRTKGKGTDAASGTALDGGPVVISYNAAEVIRNGLRTFGSDQEGWSSFVRSYLKYCDVGEVRQAYFAFTGRGDNEFKTAFPAKRWESDEDFHLVAAAEKFGLSLRGIHEAFLLLGGRRSMDEIRARLAVVFPGPPKRKRRKKEAIKAGEVEVRCDEGHVSSDWSIDDGLLELKLEG